MTVAAKAKAPLTETAKDWWRGAVIYQIYPRSFQDSNNDGIGDLAGIVQRLPYIASLGVDAIWISPFFTSPMKDYGYDVSDYCDVDPMFGQLSDFDAVIETAHRLGIRVMIDLVLSHTSDQHPWFKESRASRENARADWYVWADPKPDGTPPNNWLSIFGGSAWHWDARREQYYLHNFLVSQPDLNLHSPAVQDALLDVARFWLNRGVDGFRLDTINFYFHDQKLRDNPALPPERRNASIAPSVNPYNHQEHLYDKNRPENLAFLRRLRERGLSGVQLVISDAHAGLKKAIARCCQGSSWQRCRVHFARNLLAKVPKGSQDMVAAALRSVFVQADAQAVEQQWDQVITMLTENFPAAADLMAQVMEEVMAFRFFPPEHWRKIWSPNPGASQQGDQAPHPRRRHLPQRCRDHPPGGCAAAGAAGGMAARWPPRLLGTVDGQAGQDQRIGSRSINSCTCCGSLITKRRSGHRPQDLHHSKGRNPK